MLRIRKFLSAIVTFAMMFSAHGAYAAAGDLVDKFDLSPFVPLVLDALMTVASAVYDLLVGGGTGVIYVFVWTFLAISLSLYALKMFFPKIWVSFIGLSGGGDMAGGVNGMSVAQNALRPCIRAIIAVTVLLPIKPYYMTNWLINPFLEFGSLYTHAITETINDGATAAPDIVCPASVIENEWVSESSCKFLVQPVADLSRANNHIIRRGFEFMDRGLRGLIVPIPHGGEDLLNVVTGILLVFTFVASNIFMAMLIIQGIFAFGMAVILYPASVLSYVVKSSDKWMNIMPAFDGIIKALQKLVITMIACAFILAINVAIVKALFQWNTSVFNVASGGTAHTNVPQVANIATGFGQHSLLWLSAILTFYIMYKIFNMTRELLNTYIGGGMDATAKTTRADWKRSVDLVKDGASRLRRAFGGKS